ncbi:protein-L-isoaspartate O-methyltransferase family protein [Limoniibacter endophyticus]|nr:protein-L-isoaspartate O-methyltransferase [Limoniibacter endophyticus]
MTTEFALQRNNMVEGQIRTIDVTNRSLLDALFDVPREEFVPAAKRAIAYSDQDILIQAAGEGQPARYLMEAACFAKLVQLADVKPGDVVLDLGCGLGYSAAVLSRLAGSVIAVEDDADLAAAASETLSRLGFDNVAVVNAPAVQGCAKEGPYDVILIEGSVEEVPSDLFKQLREGGRLVAVEGHGNAANALVYVRDGENVTSRKAFNLSIRSIAGFEKKPTFKF